MLTKHTLLCFPEDVNELTVQEEASITTRAFIFNFSPHGGGRIMPADQAFDFPCPVCKQKIIPTHLFYSIDEMLVFVGRCHRCELRSLFHGRYRPGCARRIIALQVEEKPAFELWHLLPVVNFTEDGQIEMVLR